MPIPSRLIFLFCAFVVFSGNAQDIIQLDSLQLAFKNADDTDTADTKPWGHIEVVFKSNYPKAMDYAKQAYDLPSAKIERPEADAMMEMGTIALLSRRLQNASTQYFNALKYYETAADTVYCISVYNNLGATFDRLKEFDKALAYYFKAQRLLNNQPDSEHKKKCFTYAVQQYRQHIPKPKAMCRLLFSTIKGIGAGLKVPLHQVQRHGQ